jgi:hypothetical protein
VDGWSTYGLVSPFDTALSGDETAGRILSGRLAGDAGQRALMAWHFGWSLRCKFRRVVDSPILAQLLRILMRLFVA